MCAHAVRVALTKVDGIEAVDVSLDRAMTIIQLKPDNTITLSRLRDIISANGFNPAEATIIAIGALAGTTERLSFTVSGTTELFRVRRDPGHAASFDEAIRLLAVGAPVELSGVVAAPAGERQPETVTLHRVASRTPSSVKATRDGGR